MIGQHIRLTLCFLSPLDLFTKFEGFSGVYNIDDGTWSSCFKILKKHTSVPSVCIGGVYAFCGEVIQPFEICIPASSDRCELRR